MQLEMVLSCVLTNNSHDCLKSLRRDELTQTLIVFRIHPPPGSRAEWSTTAEGAELLVGGSMCVREGIRHPPPGSVAERCTTAEGAGLLLGGSVCEGV